jgi:hypothetical protein
MCAGPIVILVCGIGLLKGRSWARLLYVIWNILGLVIGLATSPMKLMLIPSFIVFLVIAFFLFRPNATAYLARREAPADEGY